MSDRNLVVRDLGLTEYHSTWDRMKAFTDARTETAHDELWLTEHPPVYTLGQTGREEHFLQPPKIPVVNTDRGGQVTYHGPGQVVGYFLCDLKRAHLGVHDFVCLLESMMIDTIAKFGIRGERIDGQPGIYVNGRKIGALGLRVRRGCTYHGISLNVSMDLKPFSGIDPCGIHNLAVTQVSDFADAASMPQVKAEFSRVCESVWSSSQTEVATASDVEQLSVAQDS